MPDPLIFDPTPGVPEYLEPGLRRILAPNPSPMTFRGTNTYLLGETDIAVIDPGPLDDAHHWSILAALEPGQKITHILVSHAHRDHAPLAARLRASTGAPIYAYGAATAGRSAVMRALAADGLVGGGEGIDADFEPDVRLGDGDRIGGAGWTLSALHTPGHIGNHLCFAWADVCFTADHVMGWSTSLVSPPDGDLTDFMASCEKLRAEPWRRFYPGHGAPIDTPAARLAALVAHRRSREAAILAILAEHDASPGAIAEKVYRDTDAALLPAATRNVLAHLIDLHGRSLVSCQGPLGANSTFRLLDEPA